MVAAHRRAVDDSQQHLPTGLDLDHLGVGKGAPVGEKRVVFDVVQIGAGRASPCHSTHSLHAGHLSGAARHLRHGAALFQIGKDLLGRGEAEIVQHQHDFLLTGPIALITDDQRRIQQLLLLQPHVRVHPEGAAEGERKVVIGAAARQDRRPRDARHAVLLPGRSQTVPVDQARHPNPVLDPNAKPLADLRRDPFGSVGLADGEDRGGLAVYLDGAPLQSQFRRRRFSLCTRPSGSDRRRGQGGNQYGAACRHGGLSCRGSKIISPWRPDEHPSCSFDPDQDWFALLPATNYRGRVTSNGGGR